MHNKFENGGDSVLTITAINNYVKGQTIEFKENSIRLVEPHKTIATGKLNYHIRASKKYIVVESVLYGYAKNFLDAVSIYTLSGCKINNVYSIRNSSYGPEASKEVVTKFLKNYLHSSKNIEEHLPDAIEELYGDDFQRYVYASVKELQATK